MNKNKQRNVKKPRYNQRTKGKKVVEEKLDYGKDTPNKAGFNDVSWYTKNPSLLTAAASLSYNAALGSTNVWDVSATEVKTTPVAYFNGIMTINFGFCPGLSKDKSSPINIAANNIYSYVRYMNSGSKNYDAPDLMLYLLAMDSAYAYLNYMQRIYGVARVYNQRNRYYGKNLLEALGVDGLNIQSNLANFRSYINSYAAKLTSFCVPSSMPLFQRHSWMVSNIYKDSDTDKANLYAFVPKYFYKYSETTNEKGGELIPIPFVADHMTVADIITIGEDIISALQLSEDIGVMSGDILKAYGQNRLFTVSAMSDDYTVMPVYNESVLTQIHNSVSIGSVKSFNADSNKITQDPDNDNAIIWNPTFATDDANVGIPPMLNLPWENITPADSMVASRLTAMYKVSGNNITIEQCGTEIVFAYNIWTLNSRGDITRAIYHTVVANTEGSPAEEADALLESTHFDWAPIVYRVEFATAAGSPAILTHVVGDLNTYTILGNQVLRNMHECAILSELDVPALGSM